VPGGLGGRPQHVQVRPRPLGVDVVGRDRADAAEVVDAGLAATKAWWAEEMPRYLAARRENALAILRREPELIAPGAVTFIAHALVVPSSDPADIEQHDTNVEMVAMQLAQAFEEAAGAKVIDVHTPDLARLAGLPDNPGFDLLSIRGGFATEHTERGRGRSPSEPSVSSVAKEIRCIEVKSRATTGDIEVSANEWAKACNMRQDYWLYAVYNCATSTPRLVRVQDPFGNLLAKAKGSVLVSSSQVMEASEG